jgi:GNAT superfamily N-acetyltransferase
MDVHPKVAGRGIGTKLLKCAIDEALRRRFDYVTLTTFEHILWNAPFYCKRGFSTVAEVHYGKELSAIIEKEKASGLKNRIAMRFEVIHDA